MVPHRVTEQETRYSLIDPQLRKARWNLADYTQVVYEIPVSGYDPSIIEGLTDYCLYRTNGMFLLLSKPSVQAGIHVLV